MPSLCPLGMSLPDRKQAHLGGKLEQAARVVQALSSVFGV